MNRSNWSASIDFEHLYSSTSEREREIERLGVFNQKRRYKNKEIPREWLCRIASQLGLFSSVFLYNYVVNFFPLLLSDSPCCFSNPFFACAQWTWQGIFHFFFKTFYHRHHRHFCIAEQEVEEKEDENKNEFIIGVKANFQFKAFHSSCWAIVTDREWESEVIDREKLCALWLLLVRTWAMGSQSIIQTRHPLLCYYSIYWTNKNKKQTQNSSLIRKYAIFSFGPFFCVFASFLSTHTRSLCAYTNNFHVGLHQKRRCWSILVLHDLTNKKI